VLFWQTEHRRHHPSFGHPFYLDGFLVWRVVMTHLISRPGSELYLPKPKTQYLCNSPTLHFLGQDVPKPLHYLQPLLQQLLLLRFKPYDHKLQLSTITCCHNNKLQQYSADFQSLSATNSDLELTLIIITDLPSVPTSRFNSNPSEKCSGKSRSYGYKASKICQKLPDPLLRNKGS